MSIIPTHEGIWQLILDGGETRAVHVHDPTGDGLQFEAPGNLSETKLGDYRWGGEYVLRVDDGPIPTTAADLDAAAFLESTPDGACHRVSESVGGHEITFEDDRRSIGAKGSDKLGELEASVRKMLDGHFGAGEFVIGGEKVYVVDQRYAQMSPRGDMVVSISEKPRSGD